MRYRIGEPPNEQSTGLDQAAFTSLAVLSFAIGIGFIFAGLRSKHYWMSIWGSGLLLSSIAYLVLIYVIH